MSSAIYEAELSVDPDILAESIEGGALTLGASGHSTTLSTDRVTPSTLSMQPFRLVPLVLDGSTFKTTFHSADLLAEIGGKFCSSWKVLVLFIFAIGQEEP